jgi:hypothetical protein
MDIEANAEVDIEFVNVATVRVRGGRPEAQKKAVSLEERWSREVAPHLAAASVSDLDSLASRIAEAQGLDVDIKAKDAELESLRGQIASLADASQVLREASDRAKACRAALGDAPLDALAVEIVRRASAGLLAPRERFNRATERHKSAMNSQQVTLGRRSMTGISEEASAASG